MIPEELAVDLTPTDDVAGTRRHHEVAGPTVVEGERRICRAHRDGHARARGEAREHSLPSIVEVEAIRGVGRDVERPICLRTGARKHAVVESDAGIPKPVRVDPQ